MSSLLAYGMPSLPELIMLGLLGVLFFGKRLPEVGKSVAKGIVEFKKGLKSMDDDIDQSAQQPRVQSQVTTLPAAPVAQAPQGQIAPAFRFDPYTGKPINGDTVVSVPQNSQTTQTSAPVGVSGEQHQV